MRTVWVATARFGALAVILLGGIIIQDLWQRPFTDVVCPVFHEPGYIPPPGPASYPFWRDGILSFLPTPTTEFWRILRFLPLVGVVVLSVATLRWPANSRGRVGFKTSICIGGAIAFLALRLTSFLGPYYFC